jgi:hypothetical protein
VAGWRSSHIAPLSTPSSPTHAPFGGLPAGAGSSPGVGFSMLILLAGLFALGDPRARRRLRLASTPYRQAPFVLMPERPG